MQGYRHVNQHDVFEKLHLESLSKCKVKRPRSRGNETGDVAGPRCWKVMPGLYASSYTGPVLGFKYNNHESAFDLQ